MRSRWLFLLLPWLVLLLPGLVGPVLQAAPSGTFTVNTNSDIIDGNVGDGICETVSGNGICTLRAAVLEASANPGPDIINVPSGTFVLTIATGTPDSQLDGDLDIIGTVTILGAGPDSSIIDGNGELIADRVLEVYSGDVTIDGVSIRNGRSSGFGGGILIRAAANVTLSNTTVLSNTADNPGPFGGGIYNTGRLTLIHSTVSFNTTGDTNPVGGGLMHEGIALTVNDSTISENTTNGNGGGLYANNGIITIANSSISRNSSGGNGGGIYAGSHGSFTIANSTISRNSAASGGGIFSISSPLTLVNNTLSGNISTVNGGGMLVQAGTTSLYNVTIADNHADSDADGGGAGGGVSQLGGELNFINSIIAANYETQPFGGGGFIEVEGDCDGTIIALGENIVYDHDNGSCTILGAFTEAYPLFGPLANNGGPTLTHALLRGSPGIDAGDAVRCNDGAGAPLTRDQRGAPRPAYGGVSLRCDLGAYERQNFLALPLILR